MRYVGSIRNVNDAFVIAELAIRGHHPLETKRPNLPAIAPGSVFVYVKEEGVMERWVDGRAWAPSRFSRGFFVYHERRVSVERMLQREGAQFYIRHNGDTLTKKVISVIAPSGSIICVVAYSSDTQADEQDVISFAQGLGIIDLHKQLIKYKYFKSTTKPSHIPSSNTSPMKLEYVINQSSPDAMDTRTSALPSLETLKLLDETCRPPNLDCITTRYIEDDRLLSLLNTKFLC